MANDKNFLANDFILLAETWTVPIERYDLPNFEEIFRVDCSGQRKAFGVIGYALSNHIPFISQKSTISFGTAQEHGEIGMFVYNSLQIVTVYKSPKAPLQLLFQQLTKLLDEQPGFQRLIFGDFNINPNSSSFLSLLIFFDHFKIRQVKTNSISTTDGLTSIDLIFSDINNIASGVYESMTSYHKPLWARLQGFQNEEKDPNFYCGLRLCSKTTNEGSFSLCGVQRNRYTDVLGTCNENMIKLRFADNTCIYQRDINRIERQDWLYSGIIDIVSKVLREIQLPDVSHDIKTIPTVGFLPVNAVWNSGTKIGEFAEENFATILFDVDHYVVLHHNSTTDIHRTRLFCSLGRPPSLNVQQQIVKLVGKPNNNLNLHMPLIAKQPSGNECGYYAAIIAAVLRLNKNPCQLKIDGTNHKPAKWLTQLLLTRSIPNIPVANANTQYEMTCLRVQDYIIRWIDVKDKVMQENIIVSNEDVEFL